MAMLTKNEYREMLNQQDLSSRVLAKDSNGKGGGGRYKPTKRLYGDYLYACDREMFNVQYADFISR